jgi:putative transposase
MIKSIKLRIYPNRTQLKIINNTLSACNSVKNKYLEYNINEYKNNKGFITGFDFINYVTKLKKENSKYSWLKGISSKAIKEAILSKEKAFKSFFKNNKGFPKFKSRKRMNKESYYFIRNNIHYINKNIVKLPILKRIRITSGNLLPDEDSIISGRIIRHYNKYYVMFIYDEDNDNKDIIKNDIKLGIDLGIKDYAIIYDGYECHHYKHFKDLDTYKKYYDRIKELQKVISKKADYNYGKLLNKYLNEYHKEPSEIKKNEMKGKAYNSSNIRRIFIKINKIKVKLTNIRDNFIKQLVNILTARIKPSKINIEDLDISNMIEDNGTSHKLHRLISESNFYKFKAHLINKCLEYGIKLRLVDTYYPSTKLCSNCGHKNNHIRLVDRTYVCDECRMVMDRDDNSAINIYNCKSKYYEEIA